MNCRRHGSKPTLALWMLVAVADVALILATAGLLTMLFLAAAVVTLGAVALGVRQLIRQNPSAVETVSTPLAARRRA